VRGQGTQPRYFLRKPNSLGTLTLERDKNSDVTTFCPLFPSCPLGADQAEALELGVRYSPVATVLDGLQLTALDPLTQRTDGGAGYLGGLLGRVGLRA